MLLRFLPGEEINFPLAYSPLEAPPSRFMASVHPRLSMIPASSLTFAVVVAMIILPFDFMPIADLAPAFDSIFAYVKPSSL